MECRIIGLDAAGWGEAQADGVQVRVPMALPGERVRARVFAWVKGVACAECIEVADRSQARVAPRCALFGLCGGCTFQHLAYDAQLDWKRARIEELTRGALGGDAAPAVAPVTPSPRSYGYRSKITPHFHQPNNGLMGPIGFLSGPGRGRRVVDVPRCELAMEELNAELAHARQAAAARAAEYRDGATLLLVAGEEGVASDPNAFVTTRVGAQRFRYRAREFFQNNPFQLPALVDHVREMTSEDGRPCLIDAYCGCGLFAVACAERFDTVLGVETSPGSVECASENARENGVHHARFEQRAAETLFADLGVHGRDVALVLDPPRKGCSPAFLDGLGRLAPGRVVYVSCNPAAQAADLRALVAMGYRPRSIRPFDLFPQTPHVECVMTLTRP